MAKSNPTRRKLDALRQPAKALLGALKCGDPDAIDTMMAHLPAAKGMTAEQVRQTHFHLADAESAIAHKTGFSDWPMLAKHLKQLRGLEGTWAFVSLTIDGSNLPAAALGASRILIDDDRFRTDSPEATYEGIFSINVEAEPHEIDIEFVEGPEAGHWNFGVFRQDGEHLELCLDLNGKARPAAFVTNQGSGHAHEVLQRVSESRPEGVTGGTAPAPNPIPAPADRIGFEFVASSTLTRLQGEWSATKIVRDGQEFPKAMLETGKRIASKNELRITFAGQVVIHANVRIDESKDPMHVDYCLVGGPAKGSLQLGIMKWNGEEACFCMASTQQPRPTDFSSLAGSGRTLSQWRLKR